MNIDYFIILNIIVLLTAGQHIARLPVSFPRKMLYATAPVMFSIMLYLLMTDGSRKYALIFFNYLAIITLIFMETWGWAYIEKWVSKIWHYFSRKNK